jgi:cyclopropane-fatty-acyl-phospholipid synthase
MRSTTPLASASQGGPETVIVLHRWRALRRLITGGDIGFAEGYIAGEWSTPDLVALIEMLATNCDYFGSR